MISVGEHDLGGREKLHHSLEWRGVVYFFKSFDGYGPILVFVDYYISLLFLGMIELWSHARCARRPLKLVGVISNS